ncbi:MAG TPA: TerC family protein [Deinococcales bacterium]|nr:TerC family protein [Deinococcales bacterium]
MTVLAALFSIIVSDLVLSGDNALVIGMAVHDLDAKNRRLAILLGTAGAIGLRFLFTLTASFLLRVPLISALGGLALFYIGYKLFSDSSGPSRGSTRAGLIGAIQTIVIADAVMSLDNALAVAGAANGHVGLLIIGLAITIPLLMVGADLIAGLFNRFRGLLTLGAAVIAWTGATLICNDELLGRLLPGLTDAPVRFLLGLAAIAGVLLAAQWPRWRDARQPETQPAEGRQGR